MSQKRPPSTAKTPTKNFLEQVLDRLDQTLKAESKAIRTLNYGEIDRMRIEKEAIESEVKTYPVEALKTLEPDEREALRERYNSLRVQAQDNNLRLEVSLRSIRGLVNALTGSTKKTYGRPGANAANKHVNAVLTSTIG